MSSTDDEAEVFDAAAGQIAGDVSDDANGHYDKVCKDSPPGDPVISACR